MNENNLKTVDNTLDGIAELWVKIIFAHIKSKKEQKNIDDNQTKPAGSKGGEKHE